MQTFYGSKKSKVIYEVMWGGCLHHIHHSQATALSLSHRNPCVYYAPDHPQERYLNTLQYTHAHHCLVHMYK